MNLKKHLTIALSLMVLSFSCSNDDDDNTQPEPKGTYENGIFVVNQGNFGQGNGSVSFISNDFSVSENTIFSNVNKKPLGDTAQSMAFYGDFAYIVVNYSQKIEVVNRYTFESVATIDSGLDNPRYMIISNGKGYVTNWGDGSNPSDDFVAVINLETNSVSAKIAVEEGPDQIISNENTIYVAHAGGYNQNNIVSVIDPNSNEITTTITVGDVPNSMVFDKQGLLYVLSGGIPDWKENETAGKLSIVNTVNNTISSTLEFEEGQHPSYLAFDESVYYYLNNEVFELAVGSSKLPGTSKIKDVNFNYMAVNNGVLYGVDAGNYTSNGTLHSFDLTTNLEKNSTDVGFIPGAIYFTAQ